MTTGLLPARPLGAPGVYEAASSPLRALTRERMDVCAFVGVSPRGPARETVFDAPWAGPRPGRRDGTAPRVLPTIPVPVESWTEYRRLYGGFEGPGLLPYAVASFFEQGGRRAYIARIVHRYGTTEDDLGVARSDLRAEPSGAAIETRAGSPVALRARNEGTWGNQLSATLSFRLVPLHFEEATPGELVLGDGTPLAEGALLRLTLAGGARVLRYVSLLREDWDPGEAVRRRRATLEYAAPAAPVHTDVVEGVLSVVDGDRRERHEGLGFSAQHPRWLAAVLWRESALLAPDPSWGDADLELDAALPTMVAGPFTGGLDRYEAIIPEDFFDPDPDRPPEEDGPPRAGVHALAEIEELSLLVVPDLYSPAPLAPIESVLDPESFAGPEFALCRAPAPKGQQETAEHDLPGLRLDPRHGNDLREIIALQRRLVRFADETRSFIVLLDVPPSLRADQVAQWRTRFDSAFAAAYHPWPDVARLDDRRDALVRVNPAAVAAGVIAEREWQLGVPHGPANVLIASAVRLSDHVTPSEHDMLHPLGINVILRERDGMRLTAARTLSRDPDYRQLSVRRLVTMLERVLERQMQWAVFEPNNAGLQSDVRHMLQSFLGELYRANAFRGAREEEAFFVRCDATLNDRRTLDRGQLIAEVGIAPAEPLEFIVLRIVQSADGTIRVED